MNDFITRSFSVMAAACLWFVTSAAAQYDQPIYTVERMNNVKYGEGLLASGESMDLLLDVYMPVESTGRMRPAIIKVHGGGWTGGNRRVQNSVPFCTFYAERGFVAFSISYRLAGNNPPPAPESWAALWAGADIPEVDASFAGAQDTATAVRYVRANAELYGVDPSIIIGAGGSAGAFNVLHVGLDDEDRFQSTLPINNPEQSSRLSAVLDHWGGHLDLASIDSNDPPVAIFHGTRDGVVPFFFAEILAGALTISRREALAFAAGLSSTGQHIVPTVNTCAVSAAPLGIQVHNGSECYSKAMHAWAFRHEVELAFILPGKPTDTGHRESFNGKLRDECFNVNLFMTFSDARDTPDAWRRMHNKFRPHLALGGMPLSEYAGALTQIKETPVPKVSNA